MILATGIKFTDVKKNAKADGRCAYTVRIDQHLEDEGSKLEIYNAAVALTRKCTTAGGGGRVQGGVVSGLGILINFFLFCGSQRVFVERAFKSYYTPPTL